jgi:hypothetical protein
VLFEPSDYPPGLVAAVKERWSLGTCTCYGTVPCRAHRHLLAAVVEEREACARILDAAADRQKAVWDRLQEQNHPGPYTSFEEIFREFAADIRARPIVTPPG